MTYHIINPNSTETMTEGMLTAARAANPARGFVGWTSHDGPEAIEGPEDGAACVPPLLRLVESASAAGSCGIAIGCFDDTGLALAQKIAACPVVGIGQAAFHLAALRGWRFSVVTTLPVSVPVIEANIAGYGLQGSLGRVRAANVPVLALERDPDGASDLVAQEVERAIQQDQIDAVVLGCAGMNRLVDRLRTRFDLPLIDPVAAAAQALDFVALGSSDL
jgi:allantoin racemase